MQTGKEAMLEPDTTAPLLRVETLCVSYARGRSRHTAVNGLSFHIGHGEAFGLVGESGSGKSSVAMAVLRYLPRNAQSSGTLAFEGDDLSALSAKQLRALRGNRIAAVYQHAGAALNPGLTIGQQIIETLREHLSISLAEARERATDLLARVRLRNPGAVLDLYPHELSGGMQQRATIAMAIALEPALLILDEPTTALDASVQTEVIAILDDLRRDHRTGLLLISHDIDLIRRATDRMGVMHNGVLVEQGETESVIARPAHAYTRGLIASIPRRNFTKRDGRLASFGDDSVIHEDIELSGERSNAPPRTVLHCRDINHAFGTHPVLHKINLEIAAGETYGLIGESGSGKSTLAKIVTGLATPASGTIEVLGKLVAGKVEARAPAQRSALQMVFQSPDTTLNPRHKLRRILSQPLRRLARVPRAAVRSKVDALLASVRLPAQYESSLPGALSGGQRQRVAIARAFAGTPGLVVLDEPTSALDVSVQATILNLLNSLQRARGTSYLFISHDLKVVRYMADRIGVLYRGHLVETGVADKVFHGPNHPYTRLLLGAVSETAHGEAPATHAGCAFAHRCALADARCEKDRPPERLDGADHMILCWRELDELEERGNATVQMQSV
jgi:peptide/nickel transport system ATP-binding protein